MTAQEVRTYIRYSGWASRKVLEAALALPPEGRAKPMGVSYESIANTLAHIYFGDAIWFSRIADPGYPVPPHDALPSLDFVIEEWPRLQARWEAWANAVTDSDLTRQVPLTPRFVGNPGLPAWQIVVHVVNHATLHRGQIVGMLRQLGMKPPATDILFYYYEQAAPVTSWRDSGHPSNTASGEAAVNVSHQGRPAARYAPRCCGGDFTGFYGKEPYSGFLRVDDGTDGPSVSSD